MITNSDGFVAVKYFQTIPHMIDVKGTKYTFVVWANICMAWIQPEHVDAVFSIRRRKCCGGPNNPNRPAEYRYANESDVRRWTNKGGS